MSGSCSVTAVVTGKVKDVSDYYFDIYQKKRWDVANRVQTEYKVTVLIKPVVMIPLGLQPDSVYVMKLVGL